MRKIILFLLVLFMFKKQFSQNGLCFTPASYGPLNNLGLTYSLCKADFNSDGQLDFVSLWLQQHVYYLNLSNGSNAYFPTITFTSNPKVSFVESGDFNSDGKFDLVLAQYNMNQVELLIGDGAGGLISLNTFSVGTNPIAILAKDFNADGKTDLAVCNQNSNNLSILIGNGLGGFLPAVNYIVGVNPHAVVAGDFNNDGKLDLSVANNGSVSILKGNGNGTFVLANTINSTFLFGYTNAGGDVMKAIDYNNDGKLDLVGVGNDSLHVIKGNGNFSFNLPTIYYAGLTVSAIDFGDFNSDGKMDFVTANYFSYNYTIFLGNQLGTFTTTNTYTISYNCFSGRPSFVTTTDMNNDGKKDIIFGHDNCGDITILLNCNTVDVGIKNYNKSNILFELFPNPANDILNIGLSDTEALETLTIQVINSFGQIVKEEVLHLAQKIKNEKTAFIKIDDLPNGVYILKLSSRGTRDLNPDSSYRRNDNYLTKRFVISQ
ncbi:MAG: FG-GAP-like repeat-containing protein [Bacteroidota bacterium]|nr:FG-GAP-like repeat-containing protein [Bacteroidota bacterium]